MDTDTKIRTAVRLILQLLANQDYAALSNLTAEGPHHLEPEDIARTIRSYPGTVRIPTESEMTFDVIAIEGSVPRQYIVDAPVFTVEEGKSDLTVRMAAVESPGDKLEVIFYDVWVM
jgi:hypothetical protein